MSILNYLISPLNRYFSRTFATWFLTCSLAVISVISLFEVTEQARRSMGNSDVKMAHILEIIFLKMPSHFQLLLPFIVLVASILTLARLNHTHEIVAAKSAGVSVWQMISGLSMVVLFIATIQLALINPIGAVLNVRLSNLENSLFSNQNSTLSISETGLWLKELTEQRESIINVKYVDLNTKELRQLTFQNFSLSGTYLSRIDAETATLNLGFWHLKNVKIWNTRDSITEHETLSLPTSLSLNKIIESNTDPEFLSFWKLPKYIQMLDQSGLSSLSYRLYWHGLIAKIGMMITMVLLAAAFSLRPIRQGFTTSLIALGIGSGFALHFMNDIVYALGLSDKLPVILSAWAPTFIMGFLSLSLLLHLEDG